jgi:Dpy-30 motif
MLKVRPDDPLSWIANYILHANKTRPMVHKNLDPEDVSLIEELRDRERNKLDKSLSGKLEKLKCGCSGESSSVSSLSQ